MLALALGVIGLALGGCNQAATDTTSGEGRALRPRQLRPDDFATAEAPPRPADEAQAAPATQAYTADLEDEALFEAAGEQDQSATAEEVAAAERLAAQAARPRIEAVAGTSGKTNGTYIMDAMVGQVNGRAIYANAVFEPLGDQLAALGRSLDGPAFQRRAGDLIAGRLEQMITDALILSEAQRDLSEGERFGLRMMVQKRREELLRLWGQGSLALAEQRLKEETGKSLDQTLEEHRQQQLVRRYMFQKIMPLINVTRRDVEQHYRENIDEYQPPVKRTVRLIRVDRAADVETVSKELGSGKPFVQVASQRFNQYRPDEGGRWPEPIVGDQGLGGALGETLVNMAVGQHQGPIEFNRAHWWLFVESEDRGQARSLREVQLDIEKELRQARFRYLSQRYRKRLYDEGSYNELEKLTLALLEVAVSRYDVPAP